MNFDAPPDFYNAREERLPARAARPEVAVVFGARDLDCDKQGDAKGGRVVARPMHAQLLALREDAIELVDVAENERGVSGRLGVLREAKRFAHTVRSRQSADLRARKLAVVVDIAGDTASVRVNWTSASFKVPAERTGFYGLEFSGVGYARCVRSRPAPSKGPSQSSALSARAAAATRERCVRASTRSLFVAR